MRRRRPDHVGGEQDRARARAEDRHPLLAAAADGLQQPLVVEEPAQRRRLSARKDEAVDGFQVLRPAHPHGLRARALERRGVFGDVALDAEDADRRRERDLGWSRRRAGGVDAHGGIAGLRQVMKSGHRRDSGRALRSSGSA